MRKSQNGQATVELALSLVVLMLIVFGIINFGMVIHGYLAISQASREGARVASLSGTDLEITQRAIDAAGTLPKDKIAVTVSPTRDLRRRGAYVTVRTSYPVPVFVPFFEKILPNPFVVHGKTVMRVE